VTLISLSAARAAVEPAMASTQIQRLKFVFIISCLFFYRFLEPQFRVAWPAD
jgi:hypothetical protein